MEYKPYSVLDSRLVWAWDWKALKLYDEGQNLLARTYYDYGNIPPPGIWLIGVPSCTIGL